jgi:hypothetical protein
MGREADLNLGPRQALCSLSHAPVQVSLILRTLPPGRGALAGRMWARGGQLGSSQAGCQAGLARGDERDRLGWEWIAGVPHLCREASTVCRDVSEGRTGALRRWWPVPVPGRPLRFSPLPSAAEAPHRPPQGWDRAPSAPNPGPSRAIAPPRGCAVQSPGGLHECQSTPPVLTR